MTERENQFAGSVGIAPAQSADALRQKDPRRRYREKWRADTRQAMDAYNERVRRDSVFGDGLRSF